MKISNILIATVLLFSFGLNSCGEDTNENETIDNTTIVKDAKKLVDLQCKVMQLVGKAKGGDSEALMESEKFNTEAEKVSRELKEKYTTQEDQERFAKAYEEALGDCN
ncbi:MAG TPA: hypothetical protein VKY37_04270 [Brumimicrobium sp.]|nr:hypothetical protein [Brumimicrobium sp.]